MNPIEPIHSNDSGIAFFWKEVKEQCPTKVQLIFKDMGFFLEPAELREFQKQILKAITRTSGCDSCSLKSECHKFLLKTPVPQVDLAVNKRELQAIEDLVNGTLFKLDLIHYTRGYGQN